LDMVVVSGDHFSIIDIYSGGGINGIERQFSRM
jgi:hypothetical protein